MLIVILGISLNRRSLNRGSTVELLRFDFVCVQVILIGQFFYLNHVNSLSRGVVLTWGGSSGRFRVDTSLSGLQK